MCLYILGCIEFIVYPNLESTVNTVMFEPQLENKSILPAFELKNVVLCFYEDWSFDSTGQLYLEKLKTFIDFRTMVSC